MGHPNERFLFPFGDSTEILKLIYLLHHVPNLKETQNIAKGRLLLPYESLLSAARELDDGKTFQEGDGGSFPKGGILSILESFAD